MTIFDHVLCTGDGSGAGDAAAALAARLVTAAGRLELVPVASLTLLEEIERRGASLAVVGMAGHSRATGIAVGSVPTFLLHEAPCSVLTVREGVDVDSWPTRIVVGVDGSPQSARALAAARELADRFGASVRPVVALLDASSDLHEARLLASDVEELSGSAVDELVHAAEDADLLVVGSRGLTGIRALGSVSERVAHSARCPVLVVRDPQRS